MYNASTIVSEILGSTPLIGWRQNPNPSTEQLTGYTTSTSGLWYNDQHPLLTFSNIQNIAPQFNTIYPTWSSVVTYSEDDIVYYAANGLFYQSLQDSSLDQDPLTETLYWELYSPLTGWIKEKTEAGILFAIQAWLDRKFPMKTARSLLERKELFSVTGQLTDTITNTGKIVGIEATPVRSRGVKMTIEAVGVQFDTNQTVTLYLFDATKAAFIQSTAFVYAGGGGIEWKTVNWEVDGRGSYYVCYDQDAISGNAINGVGDFTPYYGNNEFYPFGNWFMVSAFEVDAATSAMWNVENNVYSSDTNYGLNLRLNVKCDYTDFITEQKDLFKTAIAKGVAIQVLREYLDTMNVNRTERKVNEDRLWLELNENKDVVSLASQFNKAIDDITVDISGLDQVCFPCRKSSISIGVT